MSTVPNPFPVTVDKCPGPGSHNWHEHRPVDIGRPRVARLMRHTDLAQDLVSQERCAACGSERIRVARVEDGRLLETVLYSLPAEPAS